MNVVDVLARVEEADGALARRVFALAVRREPSWRDMMAVGGVIACCATVQAVN